MGLAHYRRHFRGSGPRRVLTAREAASILSGAPVLLPRRRDYLIESVGSHYAHTAYHEHLEALRGRVALMHPGCLSALDAHLAGRTTHTCNMLLMRRDLLADYCAWLFPILDAVDERIDRRQLTPYHARAVGRLSERLLDVWPGVNGAGYAEVPMTMIGPRRYAARVCHLPGCQIYGLALRVKRSG